MMESNGSDAVIVSAVDEAECSETTVQIKIKTLDSQTYTLQVNKRVPVPELKEQIETVTGVVSNQQRLICRGKVLKDDQLLSAYHVEDGHTLHLVVRQPLPPSSEPTNSSTGSESFADPATDPTLNAGQSRVALAHSILLGSFNMADQGDAGIPDLGRIVSAVLGSIGMNNLASSTNIVENRGLSMESGAETLEIPARATGVSSAQTDPQRDSSHGAFYHPSTASLGSLQPPVIPDSLTTLSQYLRHLRHEFISIGGHSSNPVDAATCLNEEHEQNSTSSATQVGLPTAASLADVMASTKQLLFEQVGQSLAQLARQLMDQAGLTNQSSRTGIQSSAMRTGVSLQNLGALLLELGRTTMTLRIGQTPPDAVVNAGPAVFISPSGPNPIMVQPLPFQPGSGFGATSTRTLSAGSALSGFFPRNIDIRIRTGSSLNTSNVNQGEQVGTQQTPGQTGPARDPGSGIAHQEVRVSGVPSLNGESGVRVVPVRTMVAAVPAGATRPTSGSPGSSAGLLFPIIARVQHLAPVQANSVRGSQPSSEHHPSNPEADRQQNPNAPVQPQNVRVTIGATRRDGFAGIGDPFSSGMMQMPSLRMQDPLGSLGSRSNTGSGSGPPNGEETASQIPRSHQVHTANFGSQAEATDSTNSQGANRNDATPRLSIDDGIFLSRLIREVLPYISQNSTSEPTSISPEGVDGSNNRNSQTLSTQSADRQTDAGTSRRRSDPPPTSPYGKRQKRE